MVIRVPHFCGHFHSSIAIQYAANLNPLLGSFTVLCPLVTKQVRNSKRSGGKVTLFTFAKDSLGLVAHVVSPCPAFRFTKKNTTVDNPGTRQYFLDRKAFFPNK
jgi:hypothetical protein